MPLSFMLIILVALVWNFIYLFSYGYNIRKKGNYLGIVGICLVLTMAILLFSLNLITY